MWVPAAEHERGAEGTWPSARALKSSDFLQLPCAFSPAAGKRSSSAAALLPWLEPGGSRHGCRLCIADAAGPRARGRRAVKSKLWGVPKAKLLGQGGMNWKGQEQF